MKRKFLAILLCAAMLSLTACGTTTNENSTVETEKPSENLEGSVTDILNTVYENADLDTELRDALPNYEMTQITDENAEYILGTGDVEYTEAVYSAPMMSSIAYQCVVLRTVEGADVEAVKQQLKDHADPRKWICVEAESTIVTNVGDVILFVMTDEKTASALEEAFLALGN